MKFWHASATVPLLVVETQTRQLQSIAAKDSAMLVWWGQKSSAIRPWPAANATARSMCGL
jgi:hypothetical protein